MWSGRRRARTRARRLLVRVREECPRPVLRRSCAPAPTGPGASPSSGPTRTGHEDAGRTLTGPHPPDGSSPRADGAPTGRGGPCDVRRRGPRARSPSRRLPEGGPALSAAWTGGAPPIPFT
ncbi:hypothetical protein GCM10015536_00320 [Streptomyces griseomycini]|nr:hypothetical protein GCM10015536_00320 [Streptomyces griseomycini]